MDEIVRSELNLRDNVMRLKILIIVFLVSACVPGDYAERLKLNFNNDIDIPVLVRVISKSIRHDLVKSADSVKNCLDINGQSNCECWWDNWKEINDGINSQRLLIVCKRVGLPIVMLRLSETGSAGADAFSESNEILMKNIIENIENNYHNIKIDREKEKRGLHSSKSKGYVQE
jgi:hypothetical protein